MNKTVLILLVLALPNLVVAGTEGAQLKRGAQLYDEWYVIRGEKPMLTHPAYPAAGKQEGAITWRCKECHGWDYRGQSGRYGSGPHRTGIKGVSRVRSWSHEGLVRLLGPRGRHDFESLVGKGNIAALSLFLRAGQVDTRKAIDVGGQGRGSAEQGAPLYAAHCADCHGVQGQSHDFKAAEEGLQGVGWLARDNPQKALHKILWGHPGSDMPSMQVDAGLSFGQVVDLLTYCQQLP